MQTIAVMTTTNSADEAETIAAALVDRKLAACVQVSTIESFFAWDGRTQHASEFRLFIKTCGERYPDVAAAILELHSYELPAIVALEFSEAFPPYADWVRQHSGG
jgi:periplasmic divalent cation tolerance protein